MCAPVACLKTHFGYQLKTQAHLILPNLAPSKPKRGSFAGHVVLFIIGAGFTAENLLEKALYRVEGMKGNYHQTQ